MGIGAWFKAAIVAVICISLLGFATSPAVHQAAWDNISEYVDIDAMIEGIDDTDDGTGDDGTGGDNTTEPAYLFPEYADLTLNQTITIAANGGEVSNFSITVVVPSNGGNLSNGDLLTQEVQSVDFSADPNGFVNNSDLPHPVGSWAEFWGEAYLNQSQPNLVGSNSVSISIIYNVTSHFQWWPDADVDSGTVVEIPAWATDLHMGDMLWNRSTAGQVGYEPSLSSIQTLSDQIVGGEQNVYQILRSIFMWNYENITYEVGHPQLRNVTETLENMTGDCDDQSSLFVSLARAAGVPAWMQMGMLYNDVNDTWEHHVWVQAYIPGVGNVSIDPSNDLFLLNRPDRITTYTDTGNATLMNDFYFYANVTLPPGSSGVPTISDSLEGEYYFAPEATMEVPQSHMR